MLLSLDELSSELDPSCTSILFGRFRHANPQLVQTVGRHGTEPLLLCCLLGQPEEDSMNSIIYIVGLIVVIGVVLSFFGLR